MIPLRLKKEQPGYILNSMLVPFLTAAESLLANGVADPETIDKTWMLATGAPVGPFRILDIVGLVTAHNIVVMNPQASDPETTPGKHRGHPQEVHRRGQDRRQRGRGLLQVRVGARSSRCGWALAVV